MSAHHPPDGPQNATEATTAPDPIGDQGAVPGGAQRSIEGRAAIKPAQPIPWCKRHHTHHVLYRIGGRIPVPAWLYEITPLWILRAANWCDERLAIWGIYR